MKLAVFDFDGTVIDGNSFHMWAWFLFIRNMATRNLADGLAIAISTGMRLARLISHRQWKKLILQKSISATPGDIESFTIRLWARVRPQAIDAIIRHKAERLQVVVITAAPLIYLSGIADRLGIDAVIATSIPSSAPFVEMRGDAKPLALFARYGDDAEIAIAYTDHTDDLPLLRRAKRKILVCPTRAEHAAMARSNVVVDEILYW